MSAQPAQLLAALADARHDLGHVLGLELADGHVVEEEQRLGARGEDVVRAHGHEVDAHRVVLTGQLRHLELRAHAVGAADQQRVVHALGRRDGEQAAEAADVAHHLGTVRVVHDALDGFDGARALGRVHARLRVGHRVFVHPAGHVRAVVGLRRAYGNSLSHLGSLCRIVQVGAIPHCHAAVVRGAPSPSRLRRTSRRNPSSSGSSSWPPRRGWPPGSRR